jgi:hypothetical protein
MMNQRKKDRNERPENKPERKEGPPSRENDIEDFFDELRPGKRIRIWRLEPPWCAGFLETIDISENTAIDVDYLARRWGGKALRLKRIGHNSRFEAGSVDIPMRSYPPKVRGEIITEDDVDGIKPGGVPGVRKNAATPEASINEQIAAALSGVNRPEKTGSSVSEFAKLLQVVNTQQSPILNTLLTKALQPEPVQPRSSIDELVEYAHKFETLRGLFGGGQGAPAPQNEETALLQTVGEIAKSLFNRPAQAQQFGSYDQQAGPHGHVVAGNPQNVENQDPDMAELLARADPEDTLDIVLTAFGKMPQTSKEKLKTLLDQTGLTDQIVEALVDEEDDDETEEPSDPPGGEGQ